MMRWSENDFETVRTALRLAAQEVLALRRLGQLATQDKSDQSPVTAADLRVHEILAELLAGPQGMGLPVVSEESALPDHQPQDFWLIDPIDGTRDFIAGRPDFTLNLALILNSQPVLGWVGAPAHDALFEGDVGQGRAESFGPQGRQTLRLDPKRVHPRLRTDRVKALVSFSHHDPATTSLLEALPNRTDVVVGSSLKFIRLAQGLGDWYPRGIPLYEWDIAAGHAVLQSSGGFVLDLHGQSITYGAWDQALRTRPFEAW